MNDLLLAVSMFGFGAICGGFLIYIKLEGRTAVDRVRIENLTRKLERQLCELKQQVNEKV